MKKIILILMLIWISFALTSCSKYEYNINYTFCNWNTWSIIYHSYAKPFINRYSSLIAWHYTFENVCDFKIISQTKDVIK